METRTRKKERRMSAIEKVFGLDLLREMILDYVAHNGKEVVLVQNARSCRLVSKAWLNSTSRVLMKSKEPLFRFLLSVEQKRDSPSHHAGKYLREFLQLETKGQIMGEQMPPLSIKVQPIVSMRKPCQTLSNALMICGSNLLELKFELSIFWRPLTLSIQVQLPRLRTFNVSLSSICPPLHSLSDFDDNFVDLIQSVFTASEQLKKFRLESYVFPELRTNGNLRFSPSIAELDFLNCVLDDHMIEVLGKNDLPNLKVLKFCVNKTPFKDGLITGILQNVRKTLQNLCVRDSCWGNETRGPTVFRFPLMEKLEIISIGTEYLKLEENGSSLQRLVPSLSHLTLRKQSDSSVRKWIENLCVDTVKYLDVSLVTGRRYDREGQYTKYWVSLDLGTLATISRVYPNLQELDIPFCGGETEGLTFIFSEMRNLRHLCIRVEVHQDVVNSEPWDTLLTGFRKEQLSSLKESPELWEDFQVGNDSSIRNLTELHTLVLSSVYDPGFALISDAVFDLAFFKMPNLRNLIFHGGFSATSEMKKRWREEGRFIH